MTTIENTESNFSPTMRYWGKKNSEKFHPVAYHSLDVAAVGTSLINSNQSLHRIFYSNKFISENPGILPFLLSLHDIGKYSREFQNKIQNDENNGAGHTAESLAVLLNSLNFGRLHDYFATHGENPKEIVKLFLILSKSVAGHHGKPAEPPSFPSNGLTYFGENNLRDAENFVFSMAEFFLETVKISVTGKEELKAIEKEMKHLSWILSGITVVADWIASDSYNFPYCEIEQTYSDYWKHSLQLATEILEKTGLTSSKASSVSTIKEMFGFSPRNLQLMVESIPVNHGPNLYIIEESTGGGKTEAALLLAKRLLINKCGDGFFFALPTMATANSIYERIAGDSRLYEKYYDGVNPVSVVLSHGNSILTDRYRDWLNAHMGGKENWVYDSKKKALLASIGVGTIDQALMAVLPIKHQSLRILGCAKNILIIDEVHSYDEYMNTLLMELLKYHKSCGGSAILLSATLSDEQRFRLLSIYSNKTNFTNTTYDQYPLISYADKKGNISKYVVPPSPDKYVSVNLVYNEYQIIDELLSVANRGGCACWIRNTVYDAIKAYHILKEINGIRVFLFHARFAMGDRIKHENNVIARFGKKSTSEGRKGCILIATQVVEQSLDLDFDYMVTDLAPIDLIIQRSGRLWRHNRPRPVEIESPVLTIYSPDPDTVTSNEWYTSIFPRGAFVYPEHGKLWRTAKTLKDMRGFSMPSDARHLMKMVYSPDLLAIPDCLLELDEKNHIKQKESHVHATLSSLNMDAGYRLDTVWVNDEDALTREGELSVVVELWKGDCKTGTLWCDGENNAIANSRLSLRKSIVDNYLGKSQEDGVFRLYLMNNNHIWTPIYQNKEGVSYSEEEGLSYR